MSGFQSPNHTQTPNDFFDMLPDMEESEVRVTLVMIRHTFGWHRDGFTLSIKELAGQAGLSRQGALNGAEAAENRGTFRRTNPDAQGKAKWELVLDTPLQPVEGGLQPLEGTPQANGGQVRVKERIKKPVKEKVKEEATPKQETPAEVKLYREVTKKYPPSPNYEDVIALIGKVSQRLGHPAVAEDLRPFYTAWTANGWNQFSINWLEYAVQGVPPTRKVFNANPNRTNNPANRSNPIDDENARATAERIRARRALANV